jgi:ankyrin repeat protein
MPQSQEYRDLLYVIDVLAKGNEWQFEELEKLVEGFPAATDSYFGRRWIRNAIDCGSLASVEWMLKRGVDLTFLDNEGYTAVHSALESSKPEKYKLLELLLRYGAPVNAHGINDWTPAHMAAVREDIEALRILLRFGADISIRTRIDNYSTPIEEARRCGRQHAVEFLENRA